MTPDGGAPATDVQVQAVEGMARPLVVLDEQWRFSYLDPAGAALPGETEDALVGLVIRDGYPLDRRAVAGLRPAGGSLTVHGAAP